MPRITYETKNFKPETQAIIAKAAEIVADYSRQGYSLTLRQLYYQFVARGLLANTERNYDRLGVIVSEARRAGLIDWNAIVDRTRNLRRLSSWDNPQDLLTQAMKQYHRDLWATQPYRLEVWIEKDALVGVIQDICNELDVPYFSCRGYVSDSEMWSAAAVRMQDHIDNGQDVVVLHLGDHDPSGIDMTRDIQERLCLFSFDAPIEVKRIALTMAQVEEVNPPPNPAKIKDSRYESYVSRYGYESWELDALEPRYISDLILDEVESYRNNARWQEEVRIQEEQRGQINQVIKKWEELF